MAHREFNSWVCISPTNWPGFSHRVIVIFRQMDAERDSPFWMRAGVRRTRTQCLSACIFKTRDLREKRDIYTAYRDYLLHIVNWILIKDLRYEMCDFDVWLYNTSHYRLLRRQVLPGLYIGNYQDSKDADQLERFEITHILAIHDTARRLHSVSTKNITREKCLKAPILNQILM